MSVVSWTKKWKAQQIWNNLCLSVERDLFRRWKLQGIWIPPGLYTIWVFPIIFYSNNFPRKFNNGRHHQTTLLSAWSRQEKFCLSFSNALFYFQRWIKLNFKNQIDMVVIITVKERILPLTTFKLQIRPEFYTSFSLLQTDISRRNKLWLWNINYDDWLRNIQLSTLIFILELAEDRASSSSKPISDQSL